MKKRIFSLLLVFCLAVPALFLGGCQKSLNVNEVLGVCGDALKNTFEHVLTDKTDLSTHKNVTMTKTVLSEEYDDAGVLETSTTVVKTYQRKGNGLDTVYVETTQTTTKNYEEGELLEEEVTVQKDIYTKIVTSGVTTYHKLTEYTNADNETTKYVGATYTESLFLTTVYNLSEDVMDEIADLYPGTELVLIVSIAEFEAKGNDQEGKFELSYALSEYYNGRIQETKMNGSMEYKDAKIANGSSRNERYYNGILNDVEEESTVVEYSSEITAPTSLEDYV